MKGSPYHPGKGASFCLTILWTPPHRIPRDISCLSDAGFPAGMSHPPVRFELHEKAIKKFILFGSASVASVYCTRKIELGVSRRRGLIICSLDRQNKNREQGGKCLTFSCCNCLHATTSRLYGVLMFALLSGYFLSVFTFVSFSVCLSVGLFVRLPEYLFI